LAKVFADDVLLEYTGTEPYITFLKTTVHDEGGNNNGFIDPGETVDLTATLKNIGGVNFNTLNTTLYSSDPYITIDDNSGYFGSLLIDSTKENTSDPYTITASPSAPEGHPAPCEIIINDGGFADTVDATLYIGKKHYYLWNPDPTPTQGQYMHTALAALGYSGDYGTTLAADLHIYQAVLVTSGIYPSYYNITAGSGEATQIENYLQNDGGRVYMEGNPWYINPVYFGGHDFGPVFGIDGLMYYYNAMGPLAGQTGTFTTGMSFNYTQEGTEYNDYVNTTGTGFVIFNDTNNGYHVAVANDAGTYRTVGSSFQLGCLVDATPPSTRSVLIDSIMKFFGIQLNPGVEERPQNESAQDPEFISVFPNPCTNELAISYSIHASMDVLLSVYDATGRQITTLVEQTLPAGVHAATWHVSDNHGRTVPAGIYFMKLEAGTTCDIQKVVVLN
jgi:hypothetical protein